MTSRRERIVRVTIDCIFLSPLILLFLLIAGLTLSFERAYWSRRMQAESYIVRIEKLKLEQGFYPDPRTQSFGALISTAPMVGTTAWGSS
jgi:hypothetical protein